MRILLPKILFTGLSISFLAGTKAQVSSPFTNCPQAVAIARAGNNTYNNEGVNFYNVNPATGAATVIPGGPLKNPASPANNMDFNGVGLNSIDGYLYGMGANNTTSQKFYRAGSNYSRVQVGTILPPPVTGFFEVGIVNPAAAEFDGSGNYYFTAVSGLGTIFPTTAFLPSDFYIGKISNAAALPAGTGNITPTYTALDFSNAVCSPYYLTLLTAVTQTTAQNTGLRDLVFSPRDGKLYTYVSYEFPSGSGFFVGQLLSVAPSTGIVTCYTPQLLAFASATNEVAGTAMTTTGEILVLFSGGNMYKTVFTAPNTYTGNIVVAGNSGITGGLRGDLAACATASTVVPVRFVNENAIEKDCKIQFEWTVAAEQNVSRYDVEELADGKIVSLVNAAPSNDGSGHTYHVSVPVTGKTMILRVRETDNDGSAYYSPAVTVNTGCEKIKSLTVLNNFAVTNTLDLRWNNMYSNDAYTVSIYNSVGSLVTKKQVQVSSNEYTHINTANLSAGIYLVSAISSTGEKLTERFVKK